MIRGAYDPASEPADPHRQHGDGIVDIALSVPDVDRCIAPATAQGATVREQPHDLTDERGTVRIAAVAAVAAYGDTCHTLVDRSAYTGPHLPGYVARTSSYDKWDGAPKRLFQAVDHVVGNVELGAMDQWVDFCNRVMGFTDMAEFVGEDIATDYSALMSEVVANGDHRVKFPLNEPALGKKKSRIDGFLEFYRGPGAQHVALATNDILGTVDALRAEGIEFRGTPDSYYEDPELRPASATSRPCSRRSSASRRRAATSERSRGSRQVRGESGWVVPSRLYRLTRHGARVRELYPGPA